MAYKYSFSDNETYGVDDVNAITSRLTGSGIAIFEQDTYYTPSSFNAVSEQIATSGVTNGSSSCEVIKNSTGNLEISAGDAFFSDGSAISVDSGKVSLIPISGSKNYIYFKKDQIAGTASPVISTTAPSSLDIPLAEYDPDTGSLTDKRSYSVSKISAFGSNTYNETVTFQGSFTPTSVGANSNQKIGTLTGMKRTDYKFITIRDKQYAGSSNLNQFVGYAYYTSSLKQYWSIFKKGSISASHLGYTDFLVNTYDSEKATAQYIYLERARGNEFDIFMMNYDSMKRTLNLNIEFNFC